MRTPTFILFGALAIAAGIGVWLYRRRASGGSDSGSSNDASASPATSTSTDTTTGEDVLTELQVTAQKIGLANAPRGIRNNNPGNLDYLPPGRAWNGQVGSDGRYAIYDTPANGVRAMSKQLQKDFRNGDQTLAGLITVWAPPSENNTAAYIAAVSNQVGIAPTDQLDLQGNLVPVVAALIQHENGEQPYSIDDLHQWVYLA